MIFSHCGTLLPQRKRINEVRKPLFYMLMLGCLMSITLNVRQLKQRFATSFMRAPISGSKSHMQLDRDSTSEFRDIPFEVAKAEFPIEAWESIMEVYQRINQSSSSSILDRNHSSNLDLPALRKRQLQGRVPIMNCPWGTFFAGAWCVSSEREPDPRKYDFMCDGDLVFQDSGRCSEGEICVNIEAPEAGDDRTVVCEKGYDYGEVTHVGNDKDMTVYTKLKHTHLMTGSRLIEGDSETNASFCFNKHGEKGRYRAVALTAFCLTYHKPFEESQHRWLVQPRVQPITCTLEMTGEKLCETDVSSTSKNPYTCESTMFHNVEETVQIDCSLKLAATQIALFVYVVVWRDSIVKSIVL